ncbi:hypothetical protein DV515_00009436 [Chloebia gouldiae]|uniref:Uncharacterized protein n=1 Tax=Chloebia gouldiae TaxID=44316 RepID=A0A3L8SCY1_CHLGU|nr:hypothetical protein DV515_00009436 [Chloebia gouldiae]
MKLLTLELTSVKKVFQRCALASALCHQLCVRGAHAAGALAAWEDQDAGSVWQSWLQSGALNPLLFRLCIKQIFELLQTPTLPAPNHECASLRGKDPVASAPSLLQTDDNWHLSETAQSNDGVEHRTGVGGREWRQEER